MTRTWADEKLYFDGDEFYAAVISAVERAQMHVEFETYIYDDDEIGRRFEDAFRAAAKRGVGVRLLVDGIGSSQWAERRAPQLVADGVDVRIYHPIRYAKIFARLLIEIGVGRRSASRSRAFFSKLNRRNHRKVAIIDGQLAFVGSLNVSSVHSRKASGALAWRDTAVQVQGLGIHDLTHAFDYAWVRSHEPSGRREWRRSLLPAALNKAMRRKRPNSGLVQLNYTRILRRRHLRELTHQIHVARQRIWITNAYLAPSKLLIRRLCRASERGVDVRILVPRKSDVFFMPWVAGAHYARFLKSNVRIFEYLPRFLHAKTVLIDDWVTVGTSNLNRRSLVKDFEVDLLLRTPLSEELLSRQYLIDLEESAEITVARGGWTAFLGRAIMTFMKDWI